MQKTNSPNEEPEHHKDRLAVSVSVDCAILGFHSGNIKVLLNKHKAIDKWVLPGRLITKDEVPDETANRILKESTGLGKDIYLKQFHFFGRKENGKNIVTDLHIDSKISLAYYALIKFDDAKPQINNGQEEIGWFEIGNIPKLHPKHEEIFKTAILTLRKQVGFIPIGYELLPEKFTMPELRNIYEAILCRELDRRNFQRKLLSTGYIISLNETRKIGAHKAPFLYSFDTNKYKEAERLGIQLMSNNL